MTHRARSKSKDTFGSQRPVSAVQHLKPRSIRYRPTTAVDEKDFPAIRFNTASNRESVKKFKDNTIKLKKSTTNKLLKAPEPMEAVSSFWNDEFSFKNRTLSSQASIDGSNLVKIDNLKKSKSNKVLLTRRKTGVIGMDRIIHHGTINMTLNEIKNLFKLRYEQRNEAPLDGIIFKLGIDENCPQIY